MLWSFQVDANYHPGGGLRAGAGEKLVDLEPGEDSHGTWGHTCTHIKLKNILRQDSSFEISIIRKYINKILYHFVAEFILFQGLHHVRPLKS